MHLRGISALINACKISCRLLNTLVHENISWHGLPTDRQSVWIISAYCGGACLWMQAVLVLPLMRQLSCSRVTDEWILSNGGMRTTGKTEVLEEKPVPLPLCSPKILHRWLWYGSKKFFYPDDYRSKLCRYFSFLPSVPHRTPFSSFLIHLPYRCFVVAVHKVFQS